MATRGGPGAGAESAPVGAHLVEVNAELMKAEIRDLAERYPDTEIVYPVHPNPNVRKTTDELLRGRERIHHRSADCAR